MQQSAESEARRKSFTSRSTRKGGMTEMRMNPDLNIKEEYGRSGHTILPGGNANAEGYVESTPVMNFPGGMSMAGYANCHHRCYPYNLECLGHAVAEADGPMQRLIDQLYVIEVPELKIGGKMRPMALTATARLIASYNTLVQDVGSKNPIVVKIMQAAQKAQIEDDSVEAGPGPRWNVVMKEWSIRIQKDFEARNPERASDDASLAKQVVSLENMMECFGTRMHNVENVLMARQKTDGTTIDLLTQENQLKQRRIEELEQENARLKWHRSSPSQRSPRNRSNTRATAADTVDAANVVDAGNVGAAVVDTGLSAADDDETAEQPPKKVRAADNLMSMLDGVSESHDKVGGVLVADELERLWKLGAFARLQSQCPEEEVPRKVLYDRNHVFATPMHPAFVVNSEAAKYNHGMSIVAMAMDARAWATIIEGTMDEESHRKLFFQVQKDVMNKAFQLEIEAGLREASAKPKSHAAAHSLGGRFKKIRDKWKKDKGISDEEVDKLVSSKVDGGCPPQKQSSLDGFFGAKKQPRARSCFLALLLQSKSCLK